MARLNRRALRFRCQCFNGAAPIQERNEGCRFRWHLRGRSASMEPLPFRSGMSYGASVTARIAAALQWSRSHSGAEWRGVEQCARMQRCASMEPLPFRSGMKACSGVHFPACDLLQWSRSHSGAECRVLPRGICRVAKLQWSRSHSGAECHGGHYGPSGRDGASMEPLPFRSGMAVRPISIGRTKSASMEPLPFRSGMPIRQSKCPDSLLASMEPLPFRSGMMTNESEDGTALGGFNGAAPIQERNAVVAHPPCSRWCASMEPLPFRSGMVRRRSNGVEPKGWLQWSRSHSGAEWALMSTLKQIPLLKLQWSRSHSGAECAVCAADRRIRAGCFNGAAPIQERNDVGNLGRCGLATSCFNGAAPIQERNGVTTSPYLMTATSLQWSRSHSGAECPPTLRRKQRTPSALQWSRSHSGAECNGPPLAMPLGVPAGLQWSRSHSGAEWFRKVNAADGKLRSFNGAAPIQERNASLSSKLMSPLAGFNGAAPIQERNASSGPRTKQRERPASMEPLPFRSGMHVFGPRAGYRLELQWSRSHSGAEWGAWWSRRAAGLEQSFNGAAPIQERNEWPKKCSRLFWRRVASMEPLPFRSGMPPNEDRRSSRQSASMEPLPFRSGMARASCHCRTNQGRFNGAAPIQERNAFLSPCSGQDVFQVLQWSRSHSGAEWRSRHVLGLVGREASMEPLPFRSGMNRVRLSWGTFQKCFNGAAPIQERNAGATATFQTAASAALQWSRSHSGAE